MDQLREVALLVATSESNDHIITQQEQLILDYKNLSINDSIVIVNQTSIIANQDTIIANHKASIKLIGDISKNEKEALRKEHKAKQKKLRLVVVIQAVIVLAILLIK